jgi:glycosyltransferase involved in cell wall biosynthesis
MRILMVAPQPFFQPRGTPFSVLHRIRALLNLGHTVDLVTYPFGESPVLPGLTIHRASRPPGVRDVRIGPSIAKLLLDVPLVAGTWRLARARKFDLLHTHEEAGFLCAWIARRLGLPHLYDMHSSLPQQFSNFSRYNWWPVAAAFRLTERYTLARADGIIAICPELEAHARACGYSGPLATIENTLDFEASEPDSEAAAALRRRLGLEGKVLVVYTGTLEGYQGLDLLLESAAEVRRAVPDVRFLLVGGTASQIDGLRSAAVARGAEEGFRFVEAVPPGEVPLYQRLAEVLVTTRTRGTNTPLKIYQYLRAGKPILATRIRSHTQVLDPDSAELVEPTSAGVAAGLIRVLTDPERARGLAAAALRLARERYNERVYYERLRDLLGRIGPARTAGSFLLSPQ